MNEPDAYLPGESPYLEYVYNNESEAEPIYWPVYFTQLTYPKDGSILFNDNPEQYFTYSGGWNNLFVSKQKDGRYKNLSIRAYSGDSFYFYFGAGSFSTGDSTYYAGPLTTSGVYSVLTAYSGEGDAIANKILFTAPADNITVYTLPEISVINFINLYHHEAVSGESYRLYQFLPRTLIQVDDLEADVIDAVTVRVSDSIVVTADSFEDNSILGRKIREGTVSGTLITPGTITTNLIAVSGIDADRINVTTLSALATNTGSLNVTGVITVSGEGGEIDAGLARIDQTGISIGSISAALPQANALRIYGSGSAFNVVGAAFYNGAFSPTTPLFQINLDGTGTTQFRNNKFSGAFFDFNFPTDSVSNALRVFNGNIDLRSDSTENPKAPGVYGYSESSEVRYEINHDRAYFAGYVGIGTQSPSTSLQVVGTVTATTLIAATTDSASTPGHSWVSNTNTGMFRPASNIIGFSTNGQEAARINANNVLSLNTTNANGQLTVEVSDGTSRTALTLRQLNDSSAVINFVTNSVGASTPVQTSALGTYYGKVRVAVNGTTRWLALYNT
jgi:hypothetical protein